MQPRLLLAGFACMILTGCYPTGSEWIVVSVGGCDFLGKCGVELMLNISEGKRVPCRGSWLQHITTGFNREWLPFEGQKVCRL